MIKRNFRQKVRCIKENHPYKKCSPVFENAQLALNLCDQAPGFLPFHGVRRSPTNQAIHRIQGETRDAIYENFAMYGDNGTVTEKFMHNVSLEITLFFCSK